MFSIKTMGSVRPRDDVSFDDTAYRVQYRQIDQRSAIRHCRNIAFRPRHNNIYLLLFPVPNPPCSYLFLSLSLSNGFMSGQLLQLVTLLFIEFIKILIDKQPVTFLLDGEKIQTNLIAQYPSENWDIQHLESCNLPNYYRIPVICINFLSLIGVSPIMCS